MTREEFQGLPHLLTQCQVVGCGYAPATIGKYVEHGILRAVLPKGCTQRRYQKLQLAELLGWMDLVDVKGWQREKPLLPLGAVTQWTGYANGTVSDIVAAHGLTVVQPGGIGERKFRKEEVGEWIGL
jgi:hypothetical protein